MIGPTGQVMERIGAVETLEAAAEAVGWGRDLPADEAIGIATGWWPSFPGPSGAYLKLDSDGSGTIITGAQECGTGSVMALPILAAEVLGMRPEEFRIVYQDTGVAPFDGGASGSQTTFNNGRAVIAAANEIRDQLIVLAAGMLEANPRDIELVDGMARVKGSHARAVRISDLASEAAGAELLLGRGSGAVPPTPKVDAASCVGRLGGESFAAPTFFTHAARVRVDRDTGVVRVLEVAAAHESGTIINPIGADRPGDRRGRDGHRPGPERARSVVRRWTPAQPVPPRLQAPDLCRRPADQRDLRRCTLPDCRTEGSQRRRRAALRADSRGDRECDQRSDRDTGPAAPDDPRARLGGDRDRRRRRRLVTGRFEAPTAIDAALAAVAAGSRPVAGGTDLVVGVRQGKWTMPGDLVAIDRVAELRGIGVDEAGLRIGATTSHADLCADPAIRERWTAIADAAAIVGSPATRHVGTLGGNLANASPAAETTGPLVCFAAIASVQSVRGERTIPVADLATGPGRTALEPDEIIVAVSVPSIAASGSSYVRLEFRRQMEIAVVGATAVVAMDGSRIADARIALTALAPTVRRIAAAEAALLGTDGERTAAKEAGRIAAEASMPIADVRASAEYRRAMAAVVVRRAIEGAVARARGETVAIPASASLFGAI